MNRKQLMSQLETKWKIHFVSTTEDFSGSEGGVWLSGEDSVEMKDGNDMFDYYTERYNTYTFGVHNTMYKWLEDRGWYAEWNDAGTIMLHEL
jgi:hypothetical protein